MDHRNQFGEYNHDIFVFQENANHCDHKQYDFKLHFSLLWKDYRAHYRAIKEIIISHLEQETIYIYKHVKPDLVGDRYFDWLAGKIEALHPYTGRIIYYELTPSQERFILGDQFTIYIPMPFDKIKLANLCLAVNDYCVQNGLTPGDKSDIAVNLTPFVNMRLEYVSNGEIRTRIDALQMYDTQPEERSQHKLCVVNNDLYQYLNSKFNTENSLEKTNSNYDGLEGEAASSLDTLATKKTKKSFKKNASLFFNKIFKKSDKSLPPKNVKNDTINSTGF